VKGISMTFKSMMDDDVANTILNSNEFAESITYVTKAGTELSIKAIVDRNRLDTGGEDDGRSLSKEIEVVIANNAVNGVASVDVGFDKVKLPENLGGSAIEWRIIEVIKHDEAVWHLRCAK